MKKAKIYSILISVAAVFLLDTGIRSQPQSPADHEAHHPDEKTPVESVGDAEDSAASNPMGDMMQSMHSPPQKDFYPSLLRIDEATEADRARLLSKAARRAESSAVEMRESMAALADALARDDADGMRRSSLELEAAIARFRTGITTQLAMTDTTGARAIALDWFRTEMNLPQTETVDLLYFGLTPMHLVIMAMLLTLTGFTSVSYIGRMRRASALLVSLREPNTPTDVDAFKGVLAHPRDAPAEQNPTTPISRREHWIGAVKIIGVFDETASVKTFRLALADQSPLPFAYEPGQFCTVTAPAGPEGEDVSRSYTIASSPTDRDAFELTIKREAKGLLSRHMHDTVKVGDTIRIKAPMGRFYFNGEQSDRIALVSGGVGVTPMMSALRYLASHCWTGRIEFLYFAKAEEDIIFREELTQLQARLPNVRVHIWLSEPASDAWSGRVGMINGETVLEATPDISSFRVHICGPQPMMDAAKRSMLEIGVNPSEIKMESFGDAANAPPTARQDISADGNTYAVAFARTGGSTEISNTETVLEAADVVGATIERSCLSGTCGACIVKLLQGEVTMDVDDALEASEKEEGYILACQARPQTKLTVDA